MNDITQWSIEDWSDRGVPAGVEVRRSGDVAALWDGKRHEVALRMLGAQQNETSPRERKQ